MRPFPTIRAVTDWWEAECPRRRVCVLIDYTDIGKGLQRREIYRAGGWVVGFPDNTVVTWMRRPERVKEERQ